MDRHGFIRIACVSPTIEVASPRANVSAMLARLAEHADADIVLFPELSITGYTCEDLFQQDVLLRTAREQLIRLVEATRGQRQLVVVGLPLAIQNGLYNTAAVLSGGEILGIVPKQFLPNSGEFYEKRRFTPAQGSEPPLIDIAGRPVAFGIDLLFSTRDPAGRAIGVGIEICEDLWVPVPPSSFQALAGATILLNPSASNDVIGKRQYRRDLVVSQSGRCIAAYAYAGCGPSESTTDLVFGGHCLIAENGYLLAEGDGLMLPATSGEKRDFEEDLSGNAPHARGVAIADVDVERLARDRRNMSAFADAAAFVPRSYRWIEFALPERPPGRLTRPVDGTPFVPREQENLVERCREIFSIQCRALAKRCGRLSSESSFQIGVSGGLDSTLALLVAVKTCDLMGWSRRRIHGVTLPGFGTTDRTRNNATQLMEYLGVSSDQIDIRSLSLEAFASLRHAPWGIETHEKSLDEFVEALSARADAEQGDLVFENVQARLRTFLLMSRGFVIGTGDLSEAALGWSTYNGDHMSMYNPNCSIPKTLVRALVRYVAEHEFEGAARETLLDIAETVISPELLPVSASGDLLQSTEESVGPYELHDFFLYHTLRHGFGPQKILALAEVAAFTREYEPEEIRGTLETFYRRFFANQFKRSCVPDGPKVGSVSLSPRGDWRMPSDAAVNAWLIALNGEGTPR